MDLITTETGLTIGLVITIVGAVIWLTKMWSSVRDTKIGMEKLQSQLITLERRLDEFIRIETIAQGNKEQIQIVHGRVNVLERDYGTVTDRMARIETKIDILLESLKK